MLQVSTPSPSVPSASRRGAGLLFGVGTYLIWGGLPLFFLTLDPAGPWEIVAARVVFSLVFCLLLLVLTRSWSVFRSVWRAPGLVGRFAAAAILIYVNWQMYVVAVTSGHVVESALGYFINPLVTVLLAVLVLHERLRPAQWVAVGITAVAVVVLTVDYGRLPWIALVLAGSFACYGLIKNRIGSRVDSLTGMTVETTLLTPVAGVILTIVGMSGGLTFATHGSAHFWLLVTSGPVTAIPLILFAAAAQRLPLSWLGFLQYLSPVLQFLVGVLILHESMPAARWIGFGIVWVALVVLIVDGTLESSRSHRRHQLEASRLRGQS